MHRGSMQKEEDVRHTGLNCYRDMEKEEELEIVTWTPHDFERF